MKIPTPTPIGLLVAALFAALEAASIVLFADADSVNLWLMLFTAIGSMAAVAGVLLAIWIPHKRRTAQAVKDAKEAGREEERERSERKDEAQVIAAVQEGQKKIERMFEEHRAVDHAAIWKRVDDLNIQAKEDRHGAINRLNEVLGPINLNLTNIIAALGEQAEWQKAHDKKDDARFAKIGVNE